EFNARNLATAVRASAAVMKGAAAYWGHVGKFVGRRLESDAEIAKTFSGCRTGEDAMRAQHQFVSKMISDYSREMHELLTIGADVAKGVAEPIEDRAEESVRSVEQRAAAE
ncbi:MAG TPA: phasin family protein, partial [Parvularculaceae bacterium]|nr:phasin family protein [Parvularculaceae bacterium]